MSMFAWTDCETLKNLIMATYEKGLLGPFKGKVGNTVGSNWRDIDFMRSRPRKSNKPASEKQLAQRLKFAMAIDFLTPMRNLIRVLPKGKRKSRKTDFNEAATILMKSMEGQYPDFIIPFESVIFTRGSLMNILPVVETNNSEGLRVVWSSRLGHGASENDVVNIVVYNEPRREFYFFDEAKRSTTEYSLYADEIKKGRIHIWTFVSTATETEYSNSRYCGIFEL